MKNLEESSSLEENKADISQVQKFLCEFKNKEGKDAKFEKKVPGAMKKLLNVIEDFSLDSKKDDGSQMKNVLSELNKDGTLRKMHKLGIKYGFNKHSAPLMEKIEEKLKGEMLKTALATGRSGVHRDEIGAPRRFGHADCGSYFKHLS